MISALGPVTTSACAYSVPRTAVCGVHTVCHAQLYVVCIQCATYSCMCKKRTHQKDKKPESKRCVL